MERRFRDRRALAAELTWADDARLEAERVGGRIAERPAEALEKLRRTPAGCDRLISRWSMLARAAEVGQGQWTEKPRSLAFDLLGTSIEFREGRQPGELLDEFGGLVGPVESGAALARREVEALLERRAEVADLDDVDRERTRTDLSDESHPPLKALRRYEGTLHNRLRWCLAEMRYVSPHFKPSHELTLRHVFSAKPGGASEERPDPPVASPRSEADPGWNVSSPHPPFCLEPHEIRAAGEAREEGLVAPRGQASQGRAAAGVGPARGVPWQSGGVEG